MHPVSQTSEDLKKSTVQEQAALTAGIPLLLCCHTGLSSNCCSRVFCMSLLMALKAFLFKPTLEHTLPRSSLSSTLYCTVLTLECGVCNCWWIHQLGVSELETEAMYKFCCTSGIKFLAMSVLGTLPWMNSCYARKVICYQPPASRAPQCNTCWVSGFVLKCLSGPRDVIAL